MEVVICADYEELSAAAARTVAEVVRSRPDAVLGLATGSTPLGLYKELIRMHKAEGLDFSAVTTFNLDEYVGLDGEHDQSYRYFMNENLFKHINVPIEKTSVPSGTAEDYSVHCREYERRIKEAGGIDVQILGIGSDGHIAFNEPGTSLASRTHVTTLAEQTIEDNARFFERKEDVPVHAVTMGVGTILEARRLILLANKAGKADAVAAAVEGPLTSMCTASSLQLHPDAVVFLDEAAAGRLKMADYYKWIQEKKPIAPKH
ncbi:MAG: glucosamine-6-phosphate deaminase [Phycisphaerae bacterium]